MVYLIGLLAGFASGFFSTGGGLLLHPALKSFLKLDEYKARGTTLITVFPAVLIASLFYVNYNYYDISKTIYVVIGGGLGGFAGAKIMKKIPKFWLTISFDIFLIVASIKMLIKG